MREARDAVCAEEPSQVDEALVRMQRASLPEEDL